MNCVLRFSIPPTLSESKSDSEKHPSRSIPCDELRRQPGEVVYRYPFPPPASLSILRTSSKVRDEVLEIIYQKGTLLFVIDHPSKDPASTKQSDILIKHFNNFEIFLDLDSIDDHSFSMQDMHRAMQVIRHLVQRLADYTMWGGTCTLSVHYCLPHSSFQTIFFDYLTLLAGELCVFKKVVLRFGESTQITEKGFTGSSNGIAKTLCYCQKLPCSMDDGIALDKNVRCLGPYEKSYDREGFLCMVFYPKNRVAGGGRPNGRREVNGGHWVERLMEAAAVESLMEAAAVESPMA